MVDELAAADSRHPYEAPRIGAGPFARAACKSATSVIAGGPKGRNSGGRIGVWVEHTPDHPIRR
jgi:hypothetical protein